MDAICAVPFRARATLQSATFFPEVHCNGRVDQRLGGGRHTPVDRGARDPKRVERGAVGELPVRHPDDLHLRVPLAHFWAIVNEKTWNFCETQ